MNIEIRIVGNEWAAFDPSVPNQPPLVTGGTREECLLSLQQWERGRGLIPGDSERRFWIPE